MFNLTNLATAPPSDRAALNFARAITLLSYGSLIFCLFPWRITLDFYNYCRARGLYRLACGLEDLASAMPPVNPS